MRSGLRRIAAPRIRNQGTPVPLGTSNIWGGAGLAMGGSTDEALMRAFGTQGTAYANISILARSTAAPSWGLYRKDSDPGKARYTTDDRGTDQRQQVTKHQALTVLNEPASITVEGITLPVFDRFRLFELSTVYMETAGKWHWVVGYDPRAKFPMSMWPVRPDRMTPVPDAKNYLAGWIYTAPDGRERIPLLPTEVVWDRYPDPLDPYGGVGPMSSILTDVDAARYAAEWNRNYFVNSAEPGGVIQADHTLDDTEFNDFINRWRETHRGVARSHRVALLEGGMTWVPNEHSMKDMDFANLRSVSRDIIREALAMPKTMTGVSDDVNRANAQTGQEVFAAWQIKPRLDRIKGVLNSQFLRLFGSAGAGVEFDYSLPTPVNREADAAELTAKANAWSMLVGNGADPDDAADVVGLPRMKTIEKPPPGGLPPGAPPAPAPDANAGEQKAESEGGGDVANVLAPWPVFRLGDDRFSRVNGKPLVEVR